MKHRDGLFKKTFVLGFPLDFAFKNYDAVGQVVRQQSHIIKNHEYFQFRIE